MTSNDAWILVSVPSSASISRRAATRVGLVLLAWAESRREHEPRSIDLARVARPGVGQRPFS
jgi:hypothetical protein